jgi:hypothetical protein
MSSSNESYLHAPDPTDAPVPNARLIDENSEEVFVPMTRREMFFVLDCVRQDAYRKGWPPQHQAFETVILNSIEVLDDHGPNDNWILGNV